MKTAKMQRNLPVVPIQLDSSIAIKISMGGSMFQERTLMGRSDVWHRIKILKGTQYDKDTVLKAILATVDPADLLPVKYQVSGEDTFFLARNCGPALDKLCKTNLIINNPEGDPLILVVTLGYASIHDLKINIQPLLVPALTKKYNAENRTLNLEEFHADVDISQIVHCPLSQQRTFTNILKLVKSSIGVVEHLNLQHNELSTLSAMENANLTTLKHLDLRHNNLMSMEVLAPLKNVPITKLWLDGNPLCENYAKPEKYIECAKKYCPNLLQLDGVYISSPGMPPTYTSYFKNDSREDLMNRFLCHFFHLYDQNDRALLKGLYHKNSFYSLTFGIPSPVAHKRNLVQYTANRNLLKITDPKKKCQHLYYGQDNILAGLKRLPRSYHDQKTFVCDVMYDDGKYLAIVVGGLFKSLHSAQQVLAFSRTFVLVCGDDSEYNIINDHYYVDAAPEDVTVEPKLSYDEFEPACFSPSEKKELLNMFRNVSTLNEEWSQTYLSETKWNIRKAISNFMKDYKSSAIPSEAFQR